MANVGYATLTIIPSAKGFASALAGEVDPAAKSTGEKASGSLLSTIGGGAIKVGKIAAGAVAAVGGIVGALSIKGGIARQLQIEDAQAKLTGLGHSTTAVQSIMDNALASVKGTAFGMGEAATAAAGATAAGIAPGQELTRVLSLMADSATIAGTDMASMGSIFNKVAASGKLQGDVIAQLQDAGVPVLQFVAKEMGVTAEEAAKMASAGEVNFETFANAMESGLGGAAQKSGETTRGAFANMKAAFSRFGATLSGPFVSQAKGAFAVVMNAVDGLNDLVKPAMTAFGTAFSGVVGPALERAGTAVQTFFTTVGEATSGVYAILGQGDFKPFAGLQEDAGIVDFLFNVREGVLGVKSILLDGDFSGSFLGLQEDSAVVDWLFRLRDAAIEFKAGFGDAMSGVGTALAPLGGALAGAFAQLIPAFAGVLPSISPFNLVLQGLLPVLPALAGLLAEVATTLAGALAQALTAVAPALSALASVISGTLAAVLPSVVPLIGTLATVFATLVPVVASVLAAVLPLAATLIAQLAPVITTLISTVLPPLLEVFSSLVAVIAPIVAQLAGALMPIIAALIPVVVSLVAAIAPLVGQLVSALAPILTAIAPLFGMVVSAVLPLVTTIASVLIPIVQALMPVITTVFGVVVSIITSAMQIVQGIIQVVTGVISGNWSQVWSGLGNIVSGAWNLIKSVITGALSIVQSLISAALNAVSSVFSSAWNGLKGIVSSAWNGITGAISSGVGTAVSFVSGLPGKILSALSGLASLLIDVGSNMMQGFLNGVKAVAGRIKDAVLGPIKDSVEGVKNFLGIASPSRLLRSFGEFTGQGFAIGLERTAGLIERASEVLQPTVPAVALSAPAVPAGGALARLAGGPAAGADRGGQSFHIYEATSAVQTAQEVARRQKRLGA